MAQHEPNQPQNQASNVEDKGDGKADAFAAVAIIAIVVTAVSYWLKHM